MSNIVKIEDIKGLLPIEAEALTAHYKEKIGTVKIGDLRDFISDAVRDAIMIMNIGSTPLEIAGMAKIIADDLKGSFTTYSPEEICIAIRLGAKGKLGGDAVHVSVKNIHFWIQSYNQQIRQEAIHKQRKHDEQQAKQIDEAKRLKGIADFEKSIIELYENFSGELDQSDIPVHAAMYRHIVSKHGEQIELEEKKELFYEAGKILKLNSEEKSFDQKVKERDELKYYQALTESNQKTLAESFALKSVFINWKLDKKQLTF